MAGLGFSGQIGFSGDSPRDAIVNALTGVAKDALKGAYKEIAGYLH